MNNFYIKYMSIILLSEEDIQKAKLIFLKCTKGNDKALVRWLKNIAKNKVSIYNTEKKKVLTIGKDKFDKNAQRYLKYAEKFLPEDDDELIDLKDIDNIIKEKEKKIAEIKKNPPKDAKDKLIALYKDTKKDSPEAAKKLKPEIQELMKNVSTTTTKNADGSTTTTTKYSLSGPILKKIQDLTYTMAKLLRFKDKNLVKILYNVLLKHKDKHKRIKYMCDSYEKFKKAGPKGTVSTWLKFRASSFRLSLMAIAKEKAGQELLKDLFLAYPKSKEEMNKILAKFADKSKGTSDTKETSGATGMVV